MIILGGALGGRKSSKSFGMMVTRESCQAKYTPSSADLALTGKSPVRTRGEDLLILVLTLVVVRDGFVQHSMPSGVPARRHSLGPKSGPKYLALCASQILTECRNTRTSVLS